MIYKYIEWLVILLATIIISYALSIGAVQAEDKVRTLDSEIIRLSKQYAISEKNQKVIRKIIACESANNPLAINKNIDSGGKNWSTDYSFFQINDYFHQGTMEKLGLDIENPWDNLEYGFMLINKGGFRFWKASSGCWDK